MMKRRDLLAAAGATLIGSAMAEGTFASASAAKLTPPKGPVLVAFVMGPNATIIDFAGPWEAFGDVMLPGNEMRFGFQMRTVSDSKEPLNESGLIVTPNYTYDTFPEQPNVIVIGAQRGHTPSKLAWIKEASKRADVVMSVCLGAFLLAETGLLDGLNATTHHDAYDDFAKKFPRVRLMRGPRFVDNGKIVTSGGESSGIDLAFHIVSRYYGEAVADQAAGTMEFKRNTPRPDAS